MALEDYGMLVDAIARGRAAGIDRVRQMRADEVERRRTNLAMKLAEAEETRAAALHPTALQQAGANVAATQAGTAATNREGDLGFLLNRLMLQFDPRMTSAQNTARKSGLIEVDYDPTIRALVEGAMQREGDIGATTAGNTAYRTGMAAEGVKRQALAPGGSVPTMLDLNRRDRVFDRRLEVADPYALPADGDDIGAAVGLGRNWRDTVRGFQLGGLQDNSVLSFEESQRAYERLLNPSGAAAPSSDGNAAPPMVPATAARLEREDMASKMLSAIKAYEQALERGTVPDSVDDIEFVEGAGGGWVTKTRDRNKEASDNVMALIDQWDKATGDADLPPEVQAALDALGKKKKK